jgi:hypothetical protein
MIYLSTGTNSIVVTPYQRATSIQPYYTFQIIRKGTFEEVIFYQNDTSYAQWYWSEFQITVAPTQSGLTAGIIVANSGEWTYNIYEMASPYDLNLSNAITLCQTGILIINGTYSTNQEYDQTDNSDIKYYKNM